MSASLLREGAKCVTWSKGTLATKTDDYLLATTYIPDARVQRVFGRVQRKSLSIAG